MLRSHLILVSLSIALAACAASPIQADEVRDTVRFELNEWHEIEEEFGPVTVHRIRVREMRAGLKSRIFRPGRSSGNNTDVRVEIEYTNADDHDYEADLSVHWLDADGNIIDGIVAEEDFDEHEARETTSNTFSTLRYGLEMADTLEFEVRW